MKDVSRPKRRSRISWKNNCEEGIISRFSSCFSLSHDDEFGPTSSDEVLKPLYFIIRDLSPEIMDATVVSVDDTPIHGKENTQKNFRKISPGKMKFRISRFFRNIFAGFKKNGNSKSLSLRFTRSNKSNKKDSDKMVANHHLSEMEHSSFNKNGTPTTKENPISQIHEDHHHPRHKLRYRFSNFSKLDFRKLFSRPFTEKVTRDHQDFRSEREVQNSIVDDTEALQPCPLGVSFAHPVYIGKCHMLEDDASTKISASCCTKTETDSPMDNHGYTLPPTKTTVEISRSPSWGSGCCSSLYPTDEQSSSDTDFNHSTFDSDDSTPFGDLRVSRF